MKIANGLAHTYYNFKNCGPNKSSFNGPKMNSQDEVTFCGGLKAQKLICEKMMKIYKEEFPYRLCSNSYTAQLITRHSLKINPTGTMNIEEKFAPIAWKILDNKVIERHTEKITDLRKNYRSTSDTIGLKSAVKSTRAANCGEQSSILLSIFEQNKLSAKKISIDYEVYKDFELIYSTDHSFIVSGMAKGADTKKPSTWGNNAVIVDPWSNVILEAKEGLEHFKKILGVSDKHTEGYKLIETYRNPPF